MLAVAVVDTNLDIVDLSDGLTSLREAIFAANTLGGPDTIEFDPALTANGPSIITLTNGEIKITESLTINGPGANLLTIDASGSDPTPFSSFFDDNVENDGDGSRIFNVDDGSENVLQKAVIRGLTLTGGDE